MTIFIKKLAKLDIFCNYFEKCVKLFKICQTFAIKFENLFIFYENLTSFSQNIATFRLMFLQCTNGLIKIMLRFDKHFQLRLREGSFVLEKEPFTLEWLPR